MASGATSTRVVGIEGEACQAAAGRDILILLADRLAEPIDFDFAGQLRQLLRLDLAHPVHMKRLQQRSREAAR